MNIISDKRKLPISGNSNTTSQEGKTYLSIKPIDREIIEIYMKKAM